MSACKLLIRLPILIGYGCAIGPLCPSRGAWDTMAHISGRPESVTLVPYGLLPEFASGDFF